MKDRGVGWGYNGWEIDGDARVHMGECSPVIGRITQLTDRVSGLADEGRWNLGSTVLPSGWTVPVTPMHHLYVYRQDGQACMILTRLDPFHYEHLSLSDLEMDAIMSWAKEVANEGIGKFTPADGGWFWWAK